MNMLHFYFLSITLFLSRKLLKAFAGFVAVAIILLNALNATAQTDSVYWSFGTSGAATASATSSSYAGVPAAACLADTGNASGNFTSASGYSILYFTTQFPSSGYPAASGEPTMRNNAKTGGFNATTSTYFSFTITPNTGTTVEIKEIYFAGLKNATGPTAYTIRTILDGYSTTVGNGSFSTSYGSSKKAHTGLSLQGTSGTPITVRIYVHNPLVTSTGGNVFIDDVVIYYDATTFIPPAIATGTVTGSPLCSGTNVTVPYTITGIYNSGNTFTAQLSDASGSFSSPVNMGSAISTTSGSINATIPGGTTAGSGYHIRVVSSNPVVTGSDNGADITINAAVTPSVTVAANPGSTICSGSSATFTATPVNGGASPTYQWKKNNVNVGTNSATYTDNALVNGDNITVVMTSNATCAIPATATATAITMTVNAMLTPSVTVTENPGSTICAGTPVTFTAAPVNEGASPNYQWKKNNVNVGGNSDTYIDNALANGDIITLEMTSSELCVTSAVATGNAVTMTVNPLITLSVGISVAPGDTVCDGTPVTFTATTQNGGTMPSYQWKINGSNAGGNSNIFSTSTLADGNIVTVEVLGNATCAVSTPVSSNAVPMSVLAVTPPTALLTVQPGDTIVPNQQVTFTLYIADGGINPVVTWLKNGVEIPGATGLVYSTNTLTNNDTVYCKVQSSNACANPDTTMSNAYVIRYYGTGIYDVFPASEAFRLYPNPNTGSFYIEENAGRGGSITLIVKNILGQVLYRENMHANDDFKTHVTLSGLPAGSYFMHILTSDSNHVIPFSIH